MDSQSELLDLCSAVSEAFPRSMLEQQPILLDILQSRVKAADQRHAEDPRVPRRLGVAGLAAARALMAGWWLVAEKSPQRLADASGCGRVFGVCMEVCDSFPRNDLLHLTVCGPLLKFVHKVCDHTIPYPTIPYHTTLYRTPIYLYRSYAI